jgi:hypothetical protein
MTLFQPHLVLDALRRHNVQFIIIGGLAGNILGSDSITHDLDVCYKRDDANLHALARALREVGARLRGAPEGLPFILDAQTLENGDRFTFETIGGAFDCLGTPAGTKGYDDLYASTWIFELRGNALRVCSLDDLIRMKKAADRTKDRIELEQLYVLKQLIDHRE